MNPGKSSLEGDTLKEYLCPAVKLSTGKDEQVDTGLFSLILQERNLVPAQEKGMTGEEKASHSTIGFTVVKINTRSTTSAAAPCAGLWNKHPTRTAFRNSSSQNELSKVCCSLFWVGLFFKKTNQNLDYKPLKHTQKCTMSPCQLWTL